MERIYLDHNATTPLFQEVREIMALSLKNNFGNPSSTHYFGQKSRAAVEYARESVAKLINASPAEIIFTGGGTESDNTAIFGAVAASGVSEPHIITTVIEHPALLEACNCLEKRGCSITKIGADKYGRIRTEDVADSITSNTVLVSVMMANNELGTLQPLKEIAEALSETDILFHTDAVQCGGKHNIDVRELGVDLLSLSGHKMNGPKGVGVLYVKRGVIIPPYVMGGHQEKGIRAGTENVAAIEGLGAASEIWRNNYELAEKIKRLRDFFEKEVLENISGAVVNGSTEYRVCNTSNISFDNVDGGALVINLDLKGVCASSGSACFSGLAEPSRVLTALGCSPERAKGSVRFSLGINLEKKDISRAVTVISKAVHEIRSI